MTTMKVLAMAMYLLVSSSALTVKDEATETSSSSSSNMRGFATRQLETIPQAPVVVTTEAGRTIGSAYLEALEKSMKEVESKSTTAVEGSKLSYSGNISLKAAKGQVLPLADKIKALINENSRGYLTNENFYASMGGDDGFMYDQMGVERSYNTDNTRKYISMELRVANKDFHDVMASIKALVDTDMIESSSIYGEDMADYYTATASRSKTRDVTRDALKVLLVHTDNVSDILRIHAELNNGASPECQRQDYYDPFGGMDLDSMKRKLEFGTISVTVQEELSTDIEKTELVSSDDDEMKVVTTEEREDSEILN